MKRLAACAALLLSVSRNGLAQGVPPESRGSVRISVDATGPDGVSRPAASVAVWLPGVEVQKAQTPAGGGSMASKNKRFEPRTIVVPVGSPVVFPNLDRIYHNVFSLSEGNRFDLGLYRNGASRSTTFDVPGVVRVYCNIHPQMAAFVVVVDSAHYALTGSDGLALLPGVPAGRHPVRVWDEKGGEWAGSVEVAAGKTAAVRVTLDTRGWREQPHKNKHGKDYPPPDDDENRY